MTTVTLPITACGSNCAVPVSSGVRAASNSSGRASLKSTVLNGAWRFPSISHEVLQGRRIQPGKAYSVAISPNFTETLPPPTWADFEMGRTSVFWETENGEPPAAGGGLTIYFNPSASELEVRTEFGIGFNGGFNQPIMCGGEPRIMTRKERGVADDSLYSIKINVPEHALTLEYSFTDGLRWDGPYKLQFVVPEKWRNQPVSFFNEGLANLLSSEGACATAIYPEPTFVEDRCYFPANLTIEGGNRCELDLVYGCTDPESPFYDPLANVPDECPYLSDTDSEI